jgi:hypothetical protein
MAKTLRRGTLHYDLTVRVLTGTSSVSNAFAVEQAGDGSRGGNHSISIRTAMGFVWTATVLLRFRVCNSTSELVESTEHWARTECGYRLLLKGS